MERANKSQGVVETEFFNYFSYSDYMCSTLALVIKKEIFSDCIHLSQENYRVTSFSANLKRLGNTQITNDQCSEERFTPYKGN